jgi:hypothetical protein
MLLDFSYREQQHFVLLQATSACPFSVLKPLYIDFERIPIALCPSDLMQDAF